MQAIGEATTMQDKSPVLYTKLGMNRAKKLAKELSNFAKANQLQVQIAGKQYMQVEGWQFIGTQLGLTDIVQSCDRIDRTDGSDNKEVKYKAIVEVINQHGTVISRGIAYASSLEKKKKDFEEYAIASMAQTRAIGKAYRNFLAWIVKMAGYEPTPYEEVDREKMEDDLAAAKRNTMRAFHKAGITDSSEIMKIVESVCGYAAIETIDDSRKVLAYLRDLDKDSSENA